MNHSEEFWCARQIIQDKCLPRVLGGARRVRIYDLKGEEEALFRREEIETKFLKGKAIIP
jgi:hypothetical protein